MNTPVSSPIAKLLKEKGFDGPCDHYYYKGDLESSVRDNWNRFNGCSAPTIAEVIMWLYEKHDIFVQPTICNDKTFRVGCIELKNHPLVEHIVRNKNEQLYFNSLTEAYEAAITYVLTKLI